MNDIDDDDVSPEEAREALNHDLRTKGARAAYEALLQVAMDPKAPAPARATSGVALLRAAGFFNRDDDNGNDKPVHEMSAAELDRAIRRAQREAQNGEQGPRRPARRARVGSRNVDDIFG